VLRAVAGSLAEAHQAGIVHRDIKPANVFLCAGAAWPAIKVLDFGIAGETDPERASKLTRTGTVVGSAAYMSPEQAQGHAVGAPSDLYALGVLAFEALTTRTPFDSRAFTAQLLAKVLEPAPTLREVRPTLEVPEGVEELIRDLLDRDAARRPDSAALIARCDGLLAHSTLPPLEREVLAARSLSTAPGAAKTQPMGVARTFDDGWSPPRTGSAPGVRIDVAQRPLRRVLGPAAVVAGLAGGLTWTLASRAPAPDPARAEAPLAPVPASPARDTSSERAPSEQAAAPEAPVVEGPPSATPAEPSPAPAPPATPPRAAPATDRADRSGVDRPEVDRPEVDRAAAEPRARVPASPRYPNEAAVRRAEAAGEITSLERNRLINRLHEQKAKDLRRVRRAYHAGQITRQELDDKEAAIEREFEGP
jgi:serine/threonine-protein kinase